MNLHSLPGLGLAIASMVVCASEVRAQTMNMNSATVNADPGALVNVTFAAGGQGNSVRFVLRSAHGVLLGHSIWAPMDDETRSYSVLFVDLNGNAVQPKLEQLIGMEHSNGNVSPNYASVKPG